MSNRRAVVRPAWVRRRSRVPTRLRRDWIPIATVAVAGLPGIAALVALVFTYLSVQATDAQLRISEQGQITDRYNAAIANLGSRNIEVRLGGIYALQHLMQDTPSYQPTIVAVLGAFVRNQTVQTPRPQASAPPLPTDIQAALTVVGARNTIHDDGRTVIDFDHAQLANANLNGLKFSGADFQAASLKGANLAWANLTDAKLVNANLARANFFRARLSHANLQRANLADVSLGADFRDASLDDANLRGAKFFGADFRGAYLVNANLTGANLSEANFARAFLRGANLSGAYLGADFYLAFLGDANLTGANLADANLTGAILTGAKWAKGVAPPKGWVRDPRSGRLKRAGIAG